jgi:hypothetical protein
VQYQGTSSGNNVSSNTLGLGAGASATNIIKIATPNGNVNANISGEVTLYRLYGCPRCERSVF